MEDFELVLRLLQRGTFTFVDDLLLGYRRHDFNTTKYISGEYSKSA